MLRFQRLIPALWQEGRRLRDFRGTNRRNRNTSTAARVQLTSLYRPKSPLIGNRHEVLNLTRQHHWALPEGARHARLSVLFTGGCPVRALKTVVLGTPACLAHDLNAAGSVVRTEPGYERMEGSGGSR